jgi:CRP-like cAMP-binding protein
MAKSASEPLAKVPVFADLSKKEFKAVSALTTQLPVAAGTALITEGETGREFILIVDGMAEVRVGGEKVATVGPGDFFGEIALLSDGPRTATVIAATDMRIEVIEGRDFRALTADQPKIAEPLKAAMADRLEELDERD